MSEIPSIQKKLTWEAINAFPVKHKDMSVPELRKLCVDFFRFNKTVQWTPNRDFTFIKSSKSMAKDTLEAGKVYAGFPYAMGTGNCYRLMDYLDPETGVLKIRSAAKCFRLFASQCSLGAWWGWGRVINSADYRWTYDMVEANGFLALGPYTYDKSIRQVDKQYSTIKICQDNGRQTMFESYAQLQLGDGLMYYTTAGHVVMASCDAHVEKTATGEIDGEKSYITIIDQTNKWTEQENDLGETAIMKANVDVKWTFDYLFEKHYIPFTFAEFLGTHPIEDTVCTFSHKAKTITKAELFSARINCNYGIADAYAIVKNPAGEQVYKHAVRAIRGGLKEMEFVEYEPDGEKNLNGPTDRVSCFGTPNFTPGHTVEILVQLATGERLTVYTGTLAAMPVPKIQKRLTRQAVAEFPIKHKDMTVEEMRKLCVDFYRFNKTVLWTPDDSIEFHRTPRGALDAITVGGIYAGYPYSMGTGNCYRLFDYMDEATGLVDIKKMSRVFRFMGSQCSIGCYWGWGRVINSARYDWTQNMTHARGFLRVGPYTYDETLQSFVKTQNTTHICKDNGRQTMYQSYAQLHLGDGLVYYTDAGHVVMASSEPHVEYCDDGSIDGEKSHIAIIEQASTWKPYTNEQGDSYLMKDSVDNCWSFEKLFREYYIPFTFAEFLGTYPIEDTTVSFSHAGKRISLDQLFAAEVTASHGIADLYATFTDSRGNVVYKHAVRALRAGEKVLTFDREGLQTDITGVNGPVYSADSWGKPIFDKKQTYTVTVEAQLVTGERPVIYEGVLL